jgi:hypothetical protein
VLAFYGVHVIEPETSMREKRITAFWLEFDEKWNKNDAKALVIILHHFVLLQ